MNVKFLDLKAINERHIDEFKSSFERFVDSGWYVLGDQVKDFEKDFAEYCGTKYAVGVSNGLDAIFLALKAFGVGPGDEVIVPANTYIATWLAVTYTGAKIVPVEPDLSTLNIDVSRIEEAITERTKAIISVHLYGCPVDLSSLQNVLDNNSIKVIEDCAQAHGARYKSKRVGNLGDAGAFSFYPGKNLGALGDGGAITLNDESTYNKICAIRNYGSSTKYVNDYIGYNCRLDEVQAGFLSIKLRSLDADNQKRADLAAFYNDNIDRSKYILPNVPKGCQPVWHLYTLMTSQRTALIEYLDGHGIGTIIHYPIPPHLQNAYTNLGYEDGSFPITENIHNKILSIPISPVMSQQEAEYIVQKLNEF